VTTYILEDGPRYVRDNGPSLLTGFYEARFISDQGNRITRYLTDKGRAETLRRLDAGQRDFSDEELRELTVEPRLDALEARTEAEAGEGA
jgi:hypothetical protein